MYSSTYYIVAAAISEPSWCNCISKLFTAPIVYKGNSIDTTCTVKELMDVFSSTKMALCDLEELMIIFIMRNDKVSLKHLYAYQHVNNKISRNKQKTVVNDYDDIKKQNSALKLECESLTFTIKCLRSRIETLEKLKFESDSFDFDK